MVYIIIVENRKFNTTSVSQEYYTSSKEAIKFIENRISNEDIEKHYKLLRRGLISWYEYSTKDYFYNIEVLSKKVK